MKIAKAQEMQEIDQKAISEYGIPSIVLMENAGLRVVEVIEEMLAGGLEKRVCVLAGRGNNGGDGLVISRHLLNDGYQVDTFLLGNENQLSQDTRTNYTILKKMGARINHLELENGLDALMLSLMSADLAVDAIYGTGFRGALSPLDAQAAALLNWCRVPVVAVDIPSGVEADTGRIHGEAVRATHTVTFGLPKLGLLLRPGLDCVGTLSVADISLPVELLNNPRLKHNLINDKYVKPLIKKRDPDSHKGTFGHAAIIGGSLGLTGAVVMAAEAALRSGAGLVTAALPESLLPIVAGQLMELMTRPLAEGSDGTISPGAMPAIENLLGTASACAVGPGMSRYREARKIVSFILENSGIPLVIDADGLNALQGNTQILKNRQVPLVLTPHPGEMSRLTGISVEEIQNRRIEIARSFAHEHGVTLILKGNTTVVASPGGEVFLNLTGNPGMASAGSGDVLCGLITGLIAQGLRPQDAAVAGVFLHGKAGDLASETRGERGLIAGDLIDHLPEVLRRFETLSSR